MNKHSIFINPYTKLITVIVLILICCISCTEQDKPTMFSLYDPIPLGPYSMKVVRSEAIVEDDMFQFGKGVAVFVTWDGFESEGNYESFLRSFAEKRLVVIDSHGTKYKPSHRIIQASLYYMQDVGDREWVVLFNIPEESSGLTMLIENPDPREGQPRLASVSLSR